MGKKITGAELAARNEHVRIGIADDDGLINPSTTHFLPEEVVEVCIGSWALSEDSFLVLKQPYKGKWTLKGDISIAPDGAAFQPRVNARKVSLPVMDANPLGSVSNMAAEDTPLEMDTMNFGHRDIPEVAESSTPITDAFAAAAPTPVADAIDAKIAAAAPCTCHSVPGGFAAQILETVRARNASYGTPSANHQLTADLFSSWITATLVRQGLLPAGDKFIVTAEDVCMFNVLQKASRLAFGSKDDSWLDVAGYTENVAMLDPSQRNR